MWRDFIQTFTANAEFANPASPAKLAQVGQEVGVALPNDLRSLLQESNGVDVHITFAGLEDEKPLQMSLIWSTDEIIEQNRFYRNFDEEDAFGLTDLLFFADEPNGDPIAFPIENGRVDATSTVTISHEDYQHRRVEAWSLRDYLTFFLDFS